MNRPNPRHCITGYGTKLQGVSVSFLLLQRKTLNRKLREARCMVLRVLGSPHLPISYTPGSAASNDATVYLYPQRYYFSSFHEPGIVILVHLFERSRKGTTLGIRDQGPTFSLGGGGARCQVRYSSPTVPSLG